MGRGALRARARLAGAMLVGAMLAIGAPRAAHAQDTSCDPGDVEVRGLHFTGNRAFSDAELGSAIVTTRSSWERRLFGAFGARRCIDRASDLPRDLLRLVIYYRTRGYAQAAVDTAVRSDRKGIDVTFRIREGRPVVIDSLTVAGIEAVPDRQALLRNLPARVGATFDRLAVEATRDTLERRLRNLGYPVPLVLSSSSSDTAAHRATVEYGVTAGPRAKIGEVRVTVNPRAGERQQISDRAVRSVLGVEPGDTYRYSDLTTAQRNLYQTDAYEHVDVRQRIDTARLATDSTVGLDVAVDEGYMHQLRTGIGYGTIDCFRAQADYVDRNFLPQAHGVRRLEMTGRMSKIGTGPNFGSLRSLCTPNSKQPRDAFGDKVNYYLGATLRQPTLFGLRNVPTLTLFSELRSEYNAYRRTTPIGGLASVTVRQRAPMTFGYELSLRKTEGQPALFCAVFNVCEATTIRQLEELKRLAVLSWTITRDRSNDPFNPSRGTLARLELRHASRLVGSDPELQFNKALGDASWYVTAGAGNVLAMRLRAGGVFGPRPSLTGDGAKFVPPEERLFAGGATTVRGFRQNELGPLLYVARQIDTVIVVDDSTRKYRSFTERPYDRVVPSGGNSLIVANAEYRMRSPFLRELLQWVVFADAGALWDRGKQALNLSSRTFRVTPGFGARVYTPIGPLRIDVGYNPYAQVAGPAYFNPQIVAGSSFAPLYCVSPDNDLLVHLRKDEAGREIAVQDPGDCKPTFTPQRRSGFLRRLTPTFSIQQAF